jgi:5-(carboxyamino)imidazole ribonucleotide synthase
MAERPMLPGDTIGILGGGQLGRMIALAAARLGFRCHVYAPEPDSPAFDVAAHHTVAAYDDEQALRQFSTSVRSRPPRRESAGGLSGPGAGKDAGP